ncbi:hypothetical protein BU14_0317s0021 [Porphyra umbilicalis]|uniref:Homoserine dehydrogenase n=1 Tax=Porphyra umbilicalis TaxID=2786 RepID=A0A1X6NZL5_PORUM|nr:hypothetical protein BU14_0317s0021 [Porphyra umbilicalis]|eukprot:OSX73960.1 hypothetical protein BU14_0317s0021 [Porphyra umbilicalis]
MDVAVILLGVGGVGRAVLARLGRAAPAVTGVTFRLVALVDSAVILTAAAPPGGAPAPAAVAYLDAPTLDAAAAAKAGGRPLAGLAAAHPVTATARGGGGDHDQGVLLALAASAAAAGATPLLIDASASAATTALLVAAAAAGVRVVSANKVPFSSAFSAFAALLPAPGAADDGGARASRSRRLVRAESAVAAGTPAIAALTRLVASGDAVTHIVGCFSGTLGVLTTAVAGGTRLSVAVAAARAAGITEPDPRADLSGVDVARKALILGRLAGCTTAGLADVRLEPFVPAAHLDAGGGGVDAWLAALPAADAGAAAAVAAAAAAGVVRRYVGAVDVAAGTVTVGWVELAPDSALAGLAGSTNAVVVTSGSYPRGEELVIRGSGAGVDVTAVGVVADAVELAHTAAVG